MTTVLLLGDIPSTGYVTGAHAERVSPPENQAALDAFIDLVRTRLDQAPAVLAVYPSWQADQTATATRAVGITRAALETPRLVGVPSDLPPLALSLVADQIAYLAPYVPSGVLVALVSRLADETLAGAWVRSVTGLEHVSPSLSQHLKSYLPGGFMVTAAPTTTVHSITGKNPVSELPFRPVEPVQILTAHAGGDGEWLRNRLLPALRPALVRDFQPQPLGTSYWNGKRYLEFAAFSGHPQSLTRATNSLRVRLCRWCDQPVTATTCPFCGMALPEQTPDRKLRDLEGPQVAPTAAPGSAAARYRPTNESVE